MPRKLSKPRPKQAQRLVDLRHAAGMSQAELAQAIGESSANIAFWERSEKPPRSDVLLKLCEVLKVRLEDLLEPTSPVSARNPQGKVQHLFEEVRRLPRRKQQRVVEVISALLNEYKQKKAS